ncbi:hypothetical protein D3C85_1810430 [compost metagenome]
MHAAFCLVLLQGFVKSNDTVSRRGEAPLAGALHVHPLLVEVEGQRVGATFGGLQHGATDDHEAEAGDALDALVG